MATLYGEHNRQDRPVAYLSREGQRVTEVTVRDGELYLCPVDCVIDCRTGFRFGRFEAPAWQVASTLRGLELVFGDDFEYAGAPMA